MSEKVLPKKEEAAAIWVSRDSLRPWADNPRKNAKAVQKVAESIRRFGWGSPILARRDGEIIAGHTRWQAAALLGMPLVPVRFVDLDPAEAHLLALADNKLSEIAEWDDEALSRVLSEYSVDDSVLAGWSAEDLEKIAGVADPVVEDVEPQIDKAEELRAEWRVESGQLWRLGDHLLLCGDSTRAEDVSRVMGADRADLLVTDPPYGVAVAGGTKDPRAASFRSGSEIQNDALPDSELERFVGSALGNAASVMRPGAAYYVWHPSSKVELFARCVRERLAPHRQVVVWVKERFVFGRKDYHSQHESCFYGWLEGAAHRWLGVRDQSTVWSAERDFERGVHPTVKPVSLVTTPIKNHTTPGDVLYEPFSGSGTCLVACEQTGRRCRAIEIDPKFVAVALQRWADVTGRTPEKL